MWEDVVTTGLIGTDRRPTPSGLPASWGAELDQVVDPAHAVLTLAARHRAATRAGGFLASCPPGVVAPPEQAPVASRTAHEILAQLLTPVEVDLLNLWLIAAVRYGQRASAGYWTPLAIVAARATELDRRALAQAIGERGIWFVEQNPQWARLASALRLPAQPGDSAEPVVSDAEVTEEALRADPELIMQAATPWSDQLTWTVLEIIGSGRLQQHGIRYAARVGARLPLQHYELLRSAVQRITAQLDSVMPGGLSSAREALLALERTVWLRVEMRTAFTGEPIMVERLEIPQW